MLEHWDFQERCTGSVLAIPATVKAFLRCFCFILKTTYTYWILLGFHFSITIFSGKGS